MGELKKWRDQKWVRIGTDGKIKGNFFVDDVLGQEFEPKTSR